MNNIDPALGLTLRTNITSALTLKAVPGYIATISILVGGAAGTVNDCASTGAATAANAIVALPAAVGVIAVRGKTDVGITIVPGAGQTVAVWYS
jgi:hypothetical protein